MMNRPKKKQDTKQDFVLLPLASPNGAPTVEKLETWPAWADNMREPMNEIRALYKR